jgi:hypothetical protein
MTDAGSVLRIYAWNLLYAEALVADLAPGDWTAPGGPGLENHPAWTIGHLVTGADILAQDLGLPGDVPDGWRDLFQRRGPGDPRLPDPDPAAYPRGDELLRELRRQHERVAAVWTSLPRERLKTPEPWAFGRDLPTLEDAAVFLAVSHEAMHLGELAAWRRARGLPSALGALKERRV